MHGAHYANNLSFGGIDRTGGAFPPSCPLPGFCSSLQLPTHSPAFFLQTLESLYLSTSCKQLSSLSELS